MNVLKDTLVWFFAVIIIFNIEGAQQLNLGPVRPAQPKSASEEQRLTIGIIVNQMASNAISRLLPEIVIPAMGKPIESEVIKQLQSERFRRILEQSVEAVVAQKLAQWQEGEDKKSKVVMQELNARNEAIGREIQELRNGNDGMLQEMGALRANLVQLQTTMNTRENSLQRFKECAIATFGACLGACGANLFQPKC